MKQWFVVHTQACKELIAQQHLSEQGFEVYLPRFKKTRRHARKTSEVLSPLFPRYLFVALDLGHSFWRSVNGTRGVSYLLMNNEQPIRVPDQVVNSFKQQENDEGLVPVNSMAVFTKGEKLRVLEGAFKEYTAMFDAMDDKQRVHLLLTFLGRQLKVVLPAFAVEAA